MTPWVTKLISESPIQLQHIVKTLVGQDHSGSLRVPKGSLGKVVDIFWDKELHYMVDFGNLISKRLKYGYSNKELKLAEEEDL